MLRSICGVALRCYRQVSSLRGIEAGDLVLPQTGHKYQEAYEELTAAGKNLEHGPFIVMASESRVPRFDPAALLIVMQTLPLIWRSYRSCRLRPYCAVLSYAHCFFLALHGVNQRYWLIIGDLTTHLISLAGACHAAGHKLVYWQYSFLDFKHMPVLAEWAIILNSTGRELAAPQLDTKRPGAVYWRPRINLVPPRLDSLERGPFGALLNVHADERALIKLVEFSHVLDAPIRVRIHPNSALASAKWPDCLELANPTEPLEDFVRHHTLLLGGNSQAQAKALALGTAVIHCEGLDPLEFDHHGYVQNGILPGCRDSSVLNLETIRCFFADREWERALVSHMGPSADQRAPSLRAFLCDLASA